MNEIIQKIDKFIEEDRYRGRKYTIYGLNDVDIANNISTYYLLRGYEVIHTTNTSTPTQLIKISI